MYDYSIELAAFSGFTWEHPLNSLKFSIIGAKGQDRTNILEWLRLFSEKGSILDSKTVIDLVTKQDGFFSLVVESDQHICIIVDHIASFPMFYRVDHDGHIIYVSDNPQNCSKDNKVDFKGIMEFRHMMVTMGDKTLWDQVKEVEAGTFVLIDKKTGGITKEQYFSFNREFSAKDTNVGDAKHICESVFSKTAEMFKGKCIGLPLTGGADSRAVALLLKEYGHENLKAFSIGAEDNPDVVIGKKVANKLNIPWMHINPTSSSWKSWFSSIESKRFPLYAIRGGRINSHLMGMALSMLKQIDYYPENTVFMPGQAGAIAGGALKLIPEYQQLSQRKTVKLAVLLESRTKTPKTGDLGTLMNTIYERRLVSDGISSFQDYCAAIDSIHTQDYVIKFIANDVRNYEYFGYQWYLPMMTREWIDFWFHISFNNAYGKRLLIDCVNEYGEKYGLTLTHGSYRPDSISMRMTLWPNLKRNLIKTYGRLTGSLYHLAGSEGLIESLGDPEIIKRHNRSNEIINAWAVEHSLKMLESNGLLDYIE